MKKSKYWVLKILFAIPTFWGLIALIGYANDKNTPLTLWLMTIGIFVLPGLIGIILLRLEQKSKREVN